MRNRPNGLRGFTCVAILLVAASSALAQGLERLTFQEAIDRAAMRAGKGSSDAYMADWKRSDPRAVSGDLDAEARAEADRLEARYSDEYLERLIRAHGLEARLAAPGTEPR